MGHNGPGDVSAPALTSQNATCVVKSDEMNVLDCACLATTLFAPLRGSFKSPEYWLSDHMYLNQFE